MEESQLLNGGRKGEEGKPDSLERGLWGLVLEVPAEVGDLEFSRSHPDVCIKTKDSTEGSLVRSSALRDDCSCVVT